MDEGRALFTRACNVHLATVSEAGLPVLRTISAVVEDGALIFASAEGLGRPAVASVHETVVALGRATYDVEAQAAGVLEAVETGAGTFARLRFDRVSCTERLGQDRPLAERLEVLDHLWKRGAPGDVDAISMLLLRFPELGTPAFLRPRPALHEQGFRLQCAVAGDALEDALDLLHGTYWLGDLPRTEIRAAVIASTAVVVARNANGRLVAFARAVSDGKCAWIYDVVVAPELRGAQVGSAVMEVLLDHPSVRRVRHVRLTTRDAMPFYRRLGFRDLAEAPRYAWTSTEMIRTAPSVTLSVRPLRGAGG